MQWLERLKTFRAEQEVDAPPSEPSEPEKTIEVRHQVDFTFDEVRAILADAGYDFEGDFYCYTPSSITFCTERTLNVRWTKTELVDADNT